MPIICMGCECPKAPDRFVDRWPYNGGQCECTEPTDTLPAAEDVSHLFADLAAEIAEEREQDDDDDHRLRAR